MDEPGTRQALPTYGRELLRALDADLFEDWIVFCAPEPWRDVESMFPGKPKAVVIPESMEQKPLEKQIGDLPKANVVFGIGGGSACDAAKMYAWKTGARLVLVPTILSVDAPFTKAVGVRVGGRVRYVGEVFPEKLLIDFGLLERSPKRMNRGGIGDVLSIHTALFDWKLARDRTGEAYDEEIAGQSQALLDRLLAGAADIGACNEKGLRLLSELFVGEIALCERFGNSRPEEGSEHYFAYCLEWLTRKHYMHGELIGLAVILTSLYQEQDTRHVIEFCAEASVEVRPKKIGIEPEEIREALLALPGYLQEETQLPYGVYHNKGVREIDAGRLLDGLAGLRLL